MTNISERILFIIKHFCEGNKAEFARVMGEKSQTINGWVNRGAGITIANKVLSKYPQVSPTWLITGEGEMLKGPEKKVEIQAMPMNNAHCINVPLVNQYAYAGYLNGYQNSTYMHSLPTIAYPVDSETNGNYIAFEVKGDSMNDGTSDSYLEGDRLICKELPHYLWAESKLHYKKWDFVIVHEEGILIKRIINHDVENHHITVHSLNDLYPDRVLNLEEVKQLFYVVDMSRSKRR